MNKFYFHPVGQGLFYTGSINNGKFNFVYDCGSETSGDFLENEINSYANFLTHQENKVINFVMLSHLHRDHINGLQLLLSKCKVEKIFLPYLTSDKELISLILADEIFKSKNNFEENISLFEFIISFYNFDDNNMRDEIPRVHYIDNNDRNEREEILWKSEEGYYNYLLSEYYINSAWLDYKWHFIFLNRQVKREVIKELSSKLKDVIKNFNDTHNQKIFTIIDLIRQGKIQELKNIYKEVFGQGNRLNLSSTVLIHYPDKPMDIITDTCCRYCYLHNTNVTILTGDVEFDDAINNAIKTNISNDNKYILQVPHHGSYNNWNSISYNIKSNVSCFIVPYGFGNKHRHPTGQTIAEMHMLSKDCNIKHVTQVKGFLYYIMR